MPKISKVEVYGLENSIEASKYPYATDVDSVNSDITDRTMSLAGCDTGTGHDNFLNGIIVQFDLTFSNKAWVEAERYHFLDFVSSQSTMHCISKMEIRKMCNEYVTEATIKEVERLKDLYLSTESKEDYLRLLYNIPSGFELTARMTTNYRQLKTIYQQRRTHRLPDWQMFCDWIETLPHSEFITQKFSEKEKTKNSDTKKCYECAYLNYTSDISGRIIPICRNDRFITVGRENEPTCENFIERAGISKWDSLTEYEREQYITQFKHELKTSENFKSILKVMGLKEAVEEFINDLKITDLNAWGGARNDKQ